MNNFNNILNMSDLATTGYKVGQFDLVLKDLINPYKPVKPDNYYNQTTKNYISPPSLEFVRNEIINNINPTQINQIGNDLNPSNCEISEYQQKKIKELEMHINNIGKSFGVGSDTSSNYKNKILSNYLDWVNTIRQMLTQIINKHELYYFLNFEPKTYKMEQMQDYWDVPKTDKLFSFTLFISNIENLSYLIGLVYNYAILRKHFSEYKMRLYIDFHSVFGSPEAFNLFNMFIDILDDIDPTFDKNIQMIVFFLNPYYQVVNTDSIDNSFSGSIYEPIVYDIQEVIKYYNNILYNVDNKNNYEELVDTKSPLLNIKLEDIGEGNNKIKQKSTISDESIGTKENISINVDNLEITYKNLNIPTQRSSFSMFATHLAVNLRFLPLNEDCEYHVRDLDSRLSLTDVNIINKFSNPKYQYVPFYVFQFYKFYFPYLKWRIDVNPYLAGCVGGSNKKPITISKELKESGNLKILKKEIFFKYILFISFNASNLQIGFLNDEFILANIFEKIKGSYSENILYLNLGSFANKHVNEFYYGLTNSSNYPCMLKLGTPIDILRYPLNGKYITIDPITDFKIGTISTEFHDVIKKLITEQLNIYLGKIIKEKYNLANYIRKNYKLRLEDEITSELEAALFFSMVPKKYNFDGLEDYDLELYTLNSYGEQTFSSIGSGLNTIDDNKLRASDIMTAGYLMADILEEIIFPPNPKYINSNYFLSDDNYDRLFNCMYWDDIGKKFIQRKITKKDISRKYIDQNTISHIPSELIEFKDKQQVVNTLNKEFNEYLSKSTYYPSLNWYLKKISFNKFINIGNKQIRSGILVFVQDYTKPIYNQNNEEIYSVDTNSVRTLKYNLAGNKDSIKGIEINKNRLKYNILLIDDEYINQFNYTKANNHEKINIKLLKSSHIDKLEKIQGLNKNNDFLIVNNI
jgi:hypothetical protein